MVGVVVWLVVWCGWWWGRGGGVVGGVDGSGVGMGWRVVGGCGSKWKGAIKISLDVSNGGCSMYLQGIIA